MTCSRNYFDSDAQIQMTQTLILDSYSDSYSDSMAYEDGLAAIDGDGDNIYDLDIGQNSLSLASDRGSQYTSSQD